MPRGNGGIIGPVNTSFSGVWSLTEAQLRRSANTWPSVYSSSLSESATGSDAVTVADTVDPYFEYTTLLLPGNGTNGANNNTFLDGSTNNFTVTRNGNTTQGTFSPFSQTGWGNYFDGTNDYLTSASNADYNLGTTFSVEGWIYSQAATKQVLANLSGFVYIIESTGTLNFYNGSSLFGGSGATVSRNTWVHVVFTRDASNVVRGFVNGVLTWAITVSTGTSQTAVFIGSEGGTQSFVNGYLSNVRIVKGAIPTSYQTSSTTAGTTIFTPPTSALTAISGTSLLTCQSNRFVDNSTTPKTITPTNGPTVVAFSPFNPTASWSAATYGGSGYFDGSGDYLDELTATTAFNLSSGDWTIEAWIYRNVSGVAHTILSLYNTAGSNSGLTFYVNASNQLVTDNGVTAALAAGSVGANQWVHMAIVRSGGTTTGYINGTSVGTTAQAASAAQYARIGALATGSSTFNGYIANLRVVKGTAVYTGAFTPPSLLPLTNAGSTSAAAYPSTTNVNTSFASSATSLLLNFTNAGIYDATSKNDLETVGNAQISTTQSKWGGSSISFDGTGDWLLIPDQPPQRIGTGNFTIEMWVYRNSSGTYGLAGKGTGTTGWLVSLNSSNQVVFTYGSSTITSSGTVSATTWTHIAVVREGTSTNQTKIYISGTNDGTGTVSTDFNQTNSMYIGADRTGGSAANAYVQDVRITNYARYTGNFTAPTAAFPTQ